MKVFTPHISQSKQPRTFKESQEVARQGGNVAKAARLQLEESTGKSAISPLNAKKLQTGKPLPKPKEGE